MAKSFELPQYSSSGSTLDRAFTAMLGTESNHRQLDNQGNPITSPKGAIGVAQVMPSTAPEAAKLAGLAWDEQAYRQDAGYNAALGKAYFDKQVDTFGGDVAKGMAAYNAGPGRVRKAEQQALEQGGLWTDYLPKETQDYLRKNNAQLGAAQYPSATGTVPEVQPTLTQAKDLSQILAPVTLGEQKQQQLAQTTADKQGKLDPFSTLNTDQTSVSEFLRQYGNGDPAVTLKLLTGYRNAAAKAEQAKQVKEAGYWASSDDRGSLTGELTNMAAGVWGTLNNITGQIANLGNNHQIEAGIQAASEEAKAAYPIVKAYETQVGELEQQRRLIHKNTQLSDAEKRLQLSRIDHLQSRLTEPTAEQYAALSAPTAIDNQYGEGLLPGIVKPGFRSNAVFDTATGGASNREVLDRTADALARHKTVSKAFDQGEIYNPNYNRGDFTDDLRQINKNHAPSLRENLDRLKSAIKGNSAGDMLTSGAQLAIEGGSWLTDQIGNAIEHPAAVRDYAVEMSPYLAAGELHPGLLATTNAAYGQDVTQNAIADYQKKHNGKLPSQDELTTMINAGTAAAVLEYVGDSSVLGGVRKALAKPISEGVVASATQNLKAALAATKLASNPLVKVTTGLITKAATVAADKAAPMVGSYLKEGATEGGQTYLEENVSKLNAGNPSWDKIAEATTIGGAAGGGSVGIAHIPGTVMDTVTGTAKAAKTVTKALNQKTQAQDAQATAEANQAADVTLGDYQATLDRVPDTATYQTMPETEQQAYREQLTQHINTLGSELDSLLNTLESEGRKATEPEKARARELNTALQALESKYNQIAPVTTEVTPEEVQQATQPIAPEQDTAPVISAAQKVLFHALQQPDSEIAQTSTAIADNSSVTPAQRAVAQSIPATQAVFQALTNGNRVHSEILYGTPQNKGVMTYIQQMQQAIQQQDTAKAQQVLRQLDSFRTRHQAKLAAGYNGGEHRADIKQQMEVEVAALNLAYAQLSELAIAHLPQLQQQAGQVDPIQQIQRAIDQVNLALQNKNVNKNSNIADVNDTHVGNTQSSNDQANSAPVAVNESLSNPVASQNTANVSDKNSATKAPDLTNVPLSLISEFPDFPLTKEGYIPVNNLKAEERSALEEAGVVEDIKSESGETYKAVDPEHLWVERKKRQSETNKKKKTQEELQEEWNAGIERRAQGYDRLIKEQEDMGELGDPDVIARLKAKAAEIRKGKKETSQATSNPIATAAAPLTGYAQRMADRLQQISNAKTTNDVARILKQQYSDKEQTKETTQQLEQLAQARRQVLQKQTQQPGAQTENLSTAQTTEARIVPPMPSEEKAVTVDPEDAQVSIAQIQEQAAQPETDTASETAITTEQPVAEDTYHQGQTLLAANPDSQLAQRFTAKPAKTLFHKVRNLISKLSDPAHTLAKEAKQMLSIAQYRALGEYLAHAQDVIDKLPQMLDLDNPYYAENNRNNPFADFVSKTADGRWQLDENLMAQMASATFSWLATMGGMTLRNRDEDINQLLGRDTKSAVSAEEQAAYASVGKLSNNVVEDLGQAILAQLPIQPNAAIATPQDVARLRTALGTLAAMTMLEQGYLEERWVRVTTRKDAAGIEHVSYENFQGDTAPELLPDTVVERYFRVASTQVTSQGFQREVMIPALQDIRNSFKALQPFMTDVLGNEATIDTVYLKAEEVPAYKNDSHGNPLATRQAEALTTHSARPHRIKSAMMTILKALPGAMLPMLLGADPQVETNVAEARRDSVRSANDGILDEIERLFTAYDELGDKPFFFRHSVAVNKRMHMQSQTVNPQASKLHRHAITMDDQVATVHWDNKTERQQFQIAVAEAFGAKIDKNDLEYGVNEFNRLQQNPIVQAGVTALQAILDGTYDQDHISDLMAAVEFGGESIYTLDGLLALSKMDTTQPFESDLPRKVDGVTNGTAIGLLQLVGAKSYAALRTMLARTGIFLDSNETSYGHWYNQPGNNDSYQELTARILDYFYKLPFTAPNAQTLQLLQRRSGMDFFFNVNQFISKKDGKVSSAGRKLTKPILMTSNYGASLPKLIDNLTGSLIENIYAAIEQAALNEDTAQLALIEQQVKLMLGDKAGLFTLDQAQPLKATISPAAQQILRQLAWHTYGQAIQQSLHDEYSEHKRHATLVNDAAHLAFEAFQVLYKQATDTLLQTKQQADANAQLTLADIQQVLKDLQPVSPILATAMSNLVKDDQAVLDGINLVQQIKQRQVGKTPAEKRKNSVVVQTKRLSGEKAGKARKMTMYTYQNVFKDPGVSPAVLLIQSLDASTMVELLREYGVLNVHDAAIMNSSQTETITPFFNKVFLRLNQQYSMLGATQTMLNRVLAAYRERTGDTQLKKIKFHNNYMRTAQGIRVTPAYFEQLFNTAAQQIEQNRQQVLSRIQAVVQYNAENGAYVPEKDTELTDAQLQEILAGLTQPEEAVADQYTPLDPLTIYGSISKLDNQAELDNPTVPNVEAELAQQDGVSGDDFAALVVQHEQEFPFDTVLAQLFQEPVSASTLVQVLEQHPDMGPIRQAILAKIKTMLPADLDIKVVDSPEEALENGGTEAQLVTERMTGYYTSADEKTGRPTMYLAGNKFLFHGMNSQTVLHELFHAASLVRLHEEANKPANQRNPAYAELERLYQLAQRELPDFSHRMTDIFEFVTEAHSNTAFAKALAKIKVPGKPHGNLYSGFMQSVAKLMGLFRNNSTETNVLFEVMAATNSILSQQPTVPVQPVTAAQRAMQFAQRIQDVTRNNAQLIFNELSKTNTVPVSGLQQDQLQQTLDMVLPLLDKAKLYLRNRSGNTAVHTDLLKQRIVVDIGMQAATAGIALSNQEAYLQGLLKVVLDNKLNSQQPAARQLQKIYDHVAKTLTAEDFLADPAQASDPVLMAQAQARYDYLFRSGHSQTRTRKTDYTGITQQDVYSDHLHTFVAMALTNPMLRQALGKQSSKLPKDLSVQGKSSAQWLLDLVQTLIGAMTFRLGQRAHPTLDIYIHDLVGRLAGIDQRAGAKVYAAMAAVQDRVDNQLEKVVAHVAGALSNAGASAVVQNSKSRLVKTAGKAAHVILGGNGPALATAMQQSLDRAKVLKRGLLASTIQEIAGNTERRKDLYRLLQKRVKLVDILRQDTLTKYSKYLTKLFKSTLDQDTCNAVTRVLARLDFVALVDHYGLAKAREFLTSQPQRLAEIRRLKQAILCQPNGQYYVNQAENLGYFMVHMVGKYEHVVKNAHAIAQLAGTNHKVPAGDLSQVTQQIDLLASLYAQEFADRSEQRRVEALLQAELDPADIDNPETSIAAVLHTLRELKQRSLTELFHGNPMQTQKGYVRETFDPHVEIVVADDKDGADLLKLGYVKGDQVAQDPAMATVHTKPLYYYSIDNSGNTHYRTGALSLSGMNARGIDLFQVNQSAGVADPALGAFTDRLLLQRLKQPAIDALFTAPGQPIQGSNMHAILDDHGNVTSYAYIMSDVKRRDWKKRNDDFRLVLGTSMASISDKVESQQLNREILDSLYKDYQQSYAKEPHNFVVLSSRSKDPEFRNAFQMMNGDSRRYAQQLWGKDILYIREDQFQLLFGYRPLAVSQLRYDRRMGLHGSQKAIQIANNALATLLNNEFGRTATLVWQELVHMSKDNIVIKSLDVTLNNVISNIILLKMSNVPMKDIIKDTAIAYRGAIEYQRHSQQLFEIKQTLARGVTGTKRAELLNQQRNLQQQLRNNPVRELIEEGVLQSIVEDVDTVDDMYTYEGRVEEGLSKLDKYIPEPLSMVGKTVLMHHSTPLYKLARDFAMLSDFSARYALHKYNTQTRKVKMSNAESIADIMETFVNYETPTHKVLQFLNDHDPVMFTKYLLRTQKVIAKLAQKNPTQLIMMGVLQGITGNLPDVTDSLMGVSSIHKFVPAPTSLIDGLTNSFAVNSVVK